MGRQFPLLILFLECINNIVRCTGTYIHYWCLFPYLNTVRTLSSGIQSKYFLPHWNVKWFQPYCTDMIVLVRWLKVLRPLVIFCNIFTIHLHVFILTFIHTHVCIKYEYIYSQPNCTQISENIRTFITANIHTCIHRLLVHVTMAHVSRTNVYLIVPSSTNIDIYANTCILFTESSFLFHVCRRNTIFIAACNVIPQPHTHKIVRSQIEQLYSKVI